MLCQNSSVYFDSYNGHPITENVSLWISEESCRVSLNGSTQSTYFVPILSEVSLQFEGSSPELVIFGSVMVPCNLSAVIRSSSTDDGTDILLSQRDGTDYSVSLYLPSDLMPNGAEEIYISLKYAPHSDSDYPDFVETPQLSIQTNASSSNYSHSTTFFIIISASSTVFLIIITVIIIILVYLCKQTKTRAEPESPSDTSLSLLSSDLQKTLSTNSTTLNDSTEETTFYLSDDQDPALEGYPSLSTDSSAS